MAKRSNDTLYDLPTTKDALGAQAGELDVLLEEAHFLAGTEKRLKEVKARIIELAQGLPGVRHKNLCSIVRYQRGRASLNRELLIENGVTPRQIEASMREGEGYFVCELQKIEE